MSKDTEPALDGSYLNDANLIGADLSYADLRLAHKKQNKDGSRQLVTNVELAQQAASLNGASMPNGLKHEE